MNSITNDNVLQFKNEFSNELHSILKYWMNYCIDLTHGGFYGSVNNNNVANAKAVKGLVLNSRILFTFSAAYKSTSQAEYLNTANKAYLYLTDKFKDDDFGGMYWSVDAAGSMHDGKKQIYGLAFAIYGLAEYYKVTQHSDALQLAIELYKQIEQHSFDTRANGYIEAFARDWGEIGDLRLSAKDNNERKTMNTHLHIIEGYANLYSVWPNLALKQKIENLLFLFDKYFINHQNYHLHLFFDDDWNVKSSLQSYGHDIEAAWLLQQCAEIIDHEALISKFKSLALQITNAAAEGLDSDGGLWYEFDAAKGELINEKHWWPQAEAMVGFMNAYQLSGNFAYLEKLIDSWQFVKKYLRDENNGEWFWGVNNNYTLIEKDKAGFWKCPYHNSRCFIELLNRMDCISTT